VADVANAIERAYPGLVMVHYLEKII